MDSEICISKIYHRGEPCIAIRSRYDTALINRIKKLPNRKYSNTLKLWYLPYNNESYQHIISSGITFTILNETIETRQTVPSSDTIDIESQTDSHPTTSECKNDSGNYTSDISGHSNRRPLPLIIYNSGYLVIDIKYDNEEIKFIKTIKSAYWNKKEHKWICKGTNSNLRKLQKRYNCWTQDQYQKIKKLIGLNTATKNAILKMSSETGKMELKFGYNSEIPEWLKKVAERGYNSNRRSWTIPHTAEVKTQLLEKLKESGYNLEDYTTTISPVVENSRNWSKKRAHILAKVPKIDREEVKQLLDVLIRERYSYNTIVSYIAALTRFLHYNRDHEIKMINTESVGRYISSIANSNVSNSSINLHQSAIRLYLKKVKPDQAVSFEILSRPRKHNSLPKVMSKGQVKSLLSNVNNLKHLSMLYLAYGAGMRSGEICKLSIHDIDWEKNQIWIRKAKGNKDRIVMMSIVIRNMLFEYLQKYRPKSKWVFEGQKKGTPYTSSSLSKVFKRALALAKLPTNFVLHSLRHSFATHLMDSGTDVRLIKDLLGHKDIKTTLIYTHVSNDALLRITSPLDHLNLEKLDKNKGFV